MRDDPAAVVATIQAAWCRAFASRDIDALVALYAADAQFYGSVAELFIGQDGVRRYFALLSPRYRWARFATPALMLPAAGVIAAAGPVRFGVEDDSVAGELAYRMTHVIARRDAAWRIVLHHASPKP